MVELNIETGDAHMDHFDYATGLFAATPAGEALQRDMQAWFASKGTVATIDGRKLKLRGFKGYFHMAEGTRCPLPARFA